MMEPHELFMFVTQGVESEWARVVARERRSEHVMRRERQKGTRLNGSKSGTEGRTRVHATYSVWV